jgi:hypothetical protein
MKMQCNQLSSIPQNRLFKSRPACERESLRRSIQEKGVLVPVIADETLAILDGNERYDLCGELGINDIPVEIVHGLTEEQKRDLILQLGSLHRSLTISDRKELARNELIHRQGNISDNALGLLVCLSDKTVKSVRDKLIGGSEIPNLSVRLDKNGISKPARKPRLRKIPVNSLREAVEASEILRQHGDGLPEGRMHLARARKKARQVHYCNLGNENCPPPPAEFQAHCCDFRDLLVKGHVKPNSVRLVYTDPLWQKDWAHNWPDLARVAAEMLTPGGLVLAYTGHNVVPAAIDAFRSAGLEWLSPIAILHGGPHQADHGSAIFRCFVPLVAFSKGEYRPVLKPDGNPVYFNDTYVRGGEPEKEWHPYQQDVAEAEYFISTLTQPGDLVVDLCAGGFTTMIATAKVGGRSFVGCDIEDKNVKIGWERFAKEVTAIRPDAA